MTEDEEMAARGRIVTQCGEANKRMAVLQNEAKILGEKLVNFGRPLSEGVLIKPGELPFLDRHKIESLIQDLWDTNQTKNTLRQRMKELGIEI